MISITSGISNTPNTYVLNKLRINLKGENSENSSPECSVHRRNQLHGSVQINTYVIRLSVMRGLNTKLIENSVLYIAWKRDRTQGNGK